MCCSGWREETVADGEKYRGEVLRREVLKKDQEQSLLVYFEPNQTSFH